MRKLQRYKINPLPSVPSSAEFILNGYYARINLETDLLDLYISDKWVSMGKTIEEYNDYYVKSDSEIYLRDFVLAKSRFLVNEKNIYFYYDESTDKYFFSYCEPIKKGIKKVDGVSKTITKSGERIEINPHVYPQIRDLIEIHNGSFNLYDFELKVRQSFEFKEMSKGNPISEFYIQFNMYALDENQNEYVKFLESYYNDLLGIDLEVIE